MAEEKKEDVAVEVEKKGFTPVSHFNAMPYEDFAMYDRATYVRDLSLFDNNEVMMNRGNIIRYYDCKAAKPKKVGGDIIDAEISHEEDITEESEEKK